MAMNFKMSTYKKENKPFVVSGPYADDLAGPGISRTVETATVDK